MLKIVLIVFLCFTFGECQNCPSSFVLIDDGCFIAINYLTSEWTHAQELCQDMNASLAIIKNCSQLGDLARYFYLTGYESTVGYWIGATDSANEGNWVWTDGEVVSSGVPFWGKVQNSSEWIAEPSGDTDENCALLSPVDQYYMHDENCKKSANVLCYTMPVSVVDTTFDFGKSGQGYSDQRIDIRDTYCSKDFEYVNGSCFFIGEGDGGKLTWESARDYCRINGSDLAVLTDCNLFSNLVKFLIATHPLEDGEYYWLGASDKGDEGSWYWVDYTPMLLGPPFWGSVNGTPKPTYDSELNCAALSKDDFYYFHDVACSQPSYILCQKEAVDVP